MPSIKDLIELMSASWPVALGLLLASAGILTADYLHLPYLASLPAWLPGSAFVIGILSGSVLVVAIIRELIRWAKAPFIRRRRLRSQREHLKRLHDLSEAERWLLAWAVANRRQVFSGDYFNEHVTTLLARGYLRVSSGSHLSNNMPLHIPDHVWEAINKGFSSQDLSELVGLRPFDRW
jgi:hypothetical protein